jgi:hypothetical protein
VAFALKKRRGAFLWRFCAFFNEKSSKTQHKPQKQIGENKKITKKAGRYEGRRRKKKLKPPYIWQMATKWGR